MAEPLLDMVNAMLLPGSTPETCIEIGRMATEGCLPGVPAVHSIDLVKTWLHERSHPRKPVRNARKEAVSKAIAAPITKAEIIEAARPQQPTFVINMPEQKESGAMIELAKSLGRTLEKIADNASKPAEAAQITIAEGAIQIDSPVNIDKGAVNVDIKPANINVEAAKPADIRVDNHLHVPKVKGIKRDAKGDMVAPIYED